MSARACLTADGVQLCEVRSAMERLDRWLCSSPVVCPATGAIAGVTAADRAVYWYGEAAGYHLAYLSTRRSSATARRLAPRVSGWLSRQWAAGPAQTRLYTAGAASDWRNLAVFLFDVAIVLRGLERARLAELACWSGAEAADFVRGHMLMDGRLQAVVSRSANWRPLARWSCAEDAHLLKAVAGLVRVQSLEQPARLLAAPFLRQFERGETWPHLPLHPRCYAYEGLLLLHHEPDVRERVADCLEAVMEEPDAGLDRLDVVAQVLRLLCFVRPEQPRTDQLAARLIAATDARGAVPFRTSDFPRRNTWCALFARQALDFYYRSRCGDPVAFDECI